MTAKKWLKTPKGFVTMAMITYLIEGAGGLLVPDSAEAWYAAVTVWSATHG